MANPKCRTKKSTNKERKLPQEEVHNGDAFSVLVSAMTIESRLCTGFCTGKVEGCFRGWCSQWLLLMLLILVVDQVPVSGAPYLNNEVRAMSTYNRNVKKSYDTRGRTNGKHLSLVNLEDYHPIDPVPSSSADLKAGPIEHSSPLIPYIPKPNPSNPPSSLPPLSHVPSGYP